MENVDNILNKKGMKYVFIAIIALILIISIIFIIKFLVGDYHKLTKLGYTKDEAKEIIAIDKSDKVLSLDYNEKMLDILKSDYYLDKNLEKYLEYYNNNKDKSISDIISIVNVHADNDFYSLSLKTDTDKGIAMLVNKYYTLTSEYEPELVDVKNWYAYGNQKVIKELYDQYILMFNAAKKENLTLIINDSYRSYDEQELTHKRYGDEYAARAGASEHNTGLAVDIVTYNANSDTFDETDEFAWLEAHAHEYGFILRYPKGKEYITGYAYESWHYRYLGVDLATKVYQSGLTYDEYYAYYLEDK